MQLLEDRACMQDKSTRNDCIPTCSVTGSRHLQGHRSSQSTASQSFAIKGRRAEAQDAGRFAANFNPATSAELSVDALQQNTCQTYLHL